MIYMGGVNSCSLHCRLAKFRGLMYTYKGEYGAVIGRETQFFYVRSNNFQAMVFLGQSQRPSLFQP
jgi:hypothetical protein